MDETTTEEPSPRPWDDEESSPAGAETEEGPTRVSAWPLIVALGITVSEVGVFMGVYPLAVGGLVLFVASAAGISHEAGYTSRPWRLAGGMGLVLVAVGVWMVSTQVPLAVDPLVAAVDRADGIVLRGFSVVGAGLVAALGAGVVSMLEPTEESGFPA